MQETTINENGIAPNTLALIALANEYCAAVENAAKTDITEFCNSMLRLLPRIYIAASDIPDRSLELGDAFIADSLDEEYYDSVRRGVERVMAENDTYLDVMEEDMKYSDTPIGASIAEGCADLFQVMYNYVETVREAPALLIDETTQAMRDDFEQYWSRRLCNVMRAINAVKYAD